MIILVIRVAAPRDSRLTRCTTPTNNGDVQRLIGIVCTAALAVACGPTTKATPTTSQNVLLVFTNWSPDPKVSGGPEPGYKPAFTGLTAHDIQSASAAPVAIGDYWVVNVSFTPHGADLFRKLTRDSVAACHGDPVTNPTHYCAQRHLGIWLGLSQTDINNWDDPTYATRVSQQFDLSCLTHMTTTSVCPKLVTNPVTLQEIDGGKAAIAVLPKQDANDLANAINSTLRG